MPITPPVNPQSLPQMTWFIEPDSEKLYAYTGIDLGWLNIGGEVQADNGLNIDSGPVELGGDIFKETILNLVDEGSFLVKDIDNNYTQFSVRPVENKISLVTQGAFDPDIGQFGNAFKLLMNSQTSLMEFGTIVPGNNDFILVGFNINLHKLEIRDDFNFKGATYREDYSTAGLLDDRWIPDIGTIRDLFIDKTTDQTKVGSIIFNDIDGIISNGSGTQQTHIANGGVDIVRDVGSSSALQVRTTDLSSRAYLTNGYFGAATPSGEATFRDTRILYENSGAVLTISLPDSFTGVNTIKWPSAVSGIVALTSDIPSITGFIPYTGATSDVDLNNKKMTTAGQFVYPTTGQPLTTYKNSLYTAQSFVGMQGSPEVNVSFNMDYNQVGKVGVHQYSDATLGAIWYAAGGTRGWCMQYSPANVAQTGVGDLTFTGGSGYTDGSYSLAATGGSGTGEVLNLTISGGVVVACTSSHVGDAYSLGDSLSVSGIGAGTGFSATVTSLFADIWYKSGQNMFLRGDVITGTLTLSATGASNPVVGAGVQVERYLGHASMSGTTASNGFVLNGHPVVATAAPIYLNSDNTGTTFISGGGGAAQFGSINTIAANVKYNFLGSQSATTSASALKFGVSLTPTANGQILTEAQFTPTFNVGTGALTATVTTGATSLADGTYDNLTSTATSGSGSGQTWKVTVAGGVVTTIVPATAATGGSGYAVGNTFTVSTVTGAIFTVATLGYTGTVFTSAQFNTAPIQLASLGNPTNPAVGMLYSTGTSLRFYNGAITVVGLQSGVGANTQVPIFNSSGLLVPTTPTGTGAPVLQTSPTFVTPALGTPVSGTLTNCTGLPTAGLVNNAVTYAKMQAMTTNKLLGSGSGTAVAEITLGTGLSFTGTTLNASTFTEVMTTLGDVDYYTGSARARLAGNTTTTTKFLTSTGNGTISAAPAYFDLFGSNNTWTGNANFNSVTNFNSGANSKGGFGLSFYNTANTFSTLLSVSTLTGNRNIGIPDIDGTISLAVYNSTTTALSLATLNSTYPTAGLGFMVICSAISGGGLIYIKSNSTNWTTIAAPLTT